MSVTLILGKDFCIVIKQSFGNPFIGGIHKLQGLIFDNFDQHAPTSPELQFKLNMKKSQKEGMGAFF